MFSFYGISYTIISVIIFDQSEAHSAKKGYQSQKMYMPLFSMSCHIYKIY